ncbi:ribosome recycling factor [Chlamydiifrater phoenicopteri]|uniref:ribosome recycling factor n=1 Tax=Chlamydiifrater phoenicopteri TaxID=2681469 RepID=UPI001FEB053A|nr:ribosome recycling factor [Chlamydiifrater phoenicopteri]
MSFSPTSLVSETDQKMSALVDEFRQDVAATHAGRANPGLVENVPVEAYGTSMPIKDLAVISVPDARSILISPFDASNVSAICKGILAANINLNPQTEGSVIRVIIPEISASFRESMIKLVRRKGEDAKVAIRNIRREANTAVKAATGVSEDELESAEKKIQDLTNSHCKVVDNIVKAKETDLMTI